MSRGHIYRAYAQNGSRNMRTPLFTFLIFKTLTWRENFNHPALTLVYTPFGDVKLVTQIVT